MHSRRATPVLAVIIAAVAGVIGARGDTDARPKGLTVRITDRPAAKPIRPGFVGLSLEYSALPGYAGTNPNAINPVFEQLIRNLTPGQSPQLRIGGNSTDHTWWPVPGMVKPHSATYNLSDRWTAVARALATRLNARLVLGLNMGADNPPLTAYEARNLTARIGASRIRAFEPGNEPELYGVYHSRPRSYGPPDFASDVLRISRLLPSLPLAGPATGGPKWMTSLPTFARDTPNLGLITMHRYPTRGCRTSPRSPEYHTIRNLLTARSTQGLAMTVAPYANLGVPARLDELNSVNCGGIRGVSDRFASALWALDTLFQLARVGIAGVNFHTFPGARYAPFTFTQADGIWHGSVRPLYYGMLMFAQAATPGSTLLAGSGQAAPGLDVWTVKSPGNVTRTVIVNFGAARALTVHLPTTGTATIERLTAPSLTATDHVTIGGRSFAPGTTSGALVGTPRTESLEPEANGYTVEVPAASAALLTTN